MILFRDLTRTVRYLLKVALNNAKIKAKSMFLLAFGAAFQSADDYREY